MAEPVVGSKLVEKQLFDRSDYRSMIMGIDYQESIEQHWKK
jgi:hypothetical protein